MWRHFLGDKNLTLTTDIKYRVPVAAVILPVSSDYELIFGVPQGFVLAPKFYNVLENYGQWHPIKTSENIEYCI